MADKLFKKSFMGGYNRKLVEAKFAELTAQLAAAEESINALSAQLDQKDAQLRKFEEERAFISDALLTAKKEGERMLEETQAHIAAVQAEAQAELERLQALAEEERELIRGYQKQAGSVLKEYKERVNSISI